MSNLERVRLYFLSRRGVGHTRATIYGAVENPAALILVANHMMKGEYLKAGIDRRRLITIHQLPEALEGHTRPLVIDHAALTELIYEMEKARR